MHGFVHGRPGQGRRRSAPPLPPHSHRACGPGADPARHGGKAGANLRYHPVRVTAHETGQRSPSLLAPPERRPPPVKDRPISGPVRFLLSQGLEVIIVGNRSPARVADFVRCWRPDKVQHALPFGPYRYESLLCLDKRWLVSAARPSRPPELYRVVFPEAHRADLIRPRRVVKSAIPTAWTWIPVSHPPTLLRMIIRQAQEGALLQATSRLASDPACASGGDLGLLCRTAGQASFGRCWGPPRCSIVSVVAAESRPRRYAVASRAGTRPPWPEG